MVVVTEQLPEPVDRASAVALAYVHEETVHYTWHASLLGLIGFDMAAQGRILRGGFHSIRGSTDGLAQARNMAVRTFLDEDRADWLLWVDTDAGFQPDILERLFEVADPIERPVVGALAFGYRLDDADGYNGWRGRPVPTIFDWRTDENGDHGFVVRWGYAPGQVTRCAGTGSHAILIHRRVLELVEQRFGPAWYGRLPNPDTGVLVSEDLSLCMRLGALGIPVHVHTGARTTHVKTAWIGEEDFLASTDAPPATVPTAVLVPAIRSSNAERFVATLKASTGVATVYAIANEDETEQAKVWDAAGATVLVANGVQTFAERMNAGYVLTAEPFVFIVGDDVRFRASWLDHAQAVAEGLRLDVVGTNDLGNPRVVSGQHATHLLIRRSYVDEVGASWDGPGVLCHEGYGHWFVDDELVTAAKQRGVWGMAIDSHVEHLHPIWGKGPDDAVYKAGLATVDQDLALYRARAAKYVEGPAATKAVLETEQAVPGAR